MHEVLKVLVVGDYFGEISYLHKCPITCTVVGRNYNTYARLSFPRLHMLLREFPAFKEKMLNHVHKYDDPCIRFQKKLIRQLPWVRSLQKKTFYHFISKMHL